MRVLEQLPGEGWPRCRATDNRLSQGCHACGNAGFRSLDHIKRLMPNAELYRAWATFSFIAASGRINECDLLIAVPGGCYLVEFKGHPGHVVNNGETWTRDAPGRTGSPSVMASSTRRAGSGST